MSEKTEPTAVVDAPAPETWRDGEEARQARERFRRTIERVGERKKDKDSDEVLRQVTEIVEEVRQERYERAQREAKDGHPNLFVSATLFRRGNPSALRHAWHAGAFELLLSDEHNPELTEVLSRPRLILRYNVAPENLAEIFTGLDAATRVEPSPTLPLPVRDPKVEKILAAALGGEADYLVSGDQDLLELAGDPRLGGIKIVTVGEFPTVLDRRGPVPPSAIDRP